MGGRIASLALGRRSTWIVIGVVAGTRPSRSRRCSRSCRRSRPTRAETFFTRGADSTEVDRLLDTRFPEGGDATAVIAYVDDRGLDLHAHARDLGRTCEDICATETLPALKGVGGPDGAICGELGTCSARRPAVVVLGRQPGEHGAVLGRQRPRRHRVGRRGRGGDPGAAAGAGRQPVAQLRDRRGGLRRRPQRRRRGPRRDAARDHGRAGARC